LFFISALLSFAQTNMNETLKQQLVKDWERAKAYTQEYLDAMPANKYDFRAVDSIRSFAEQMLHLAQGTVGLYRMVPVHSEFLQVRILKNLLLLKQRIL
jgi:hypothetical protein